MCVHVWCVCEIERRKESKRTMSFTWLLCTFLPVDFAASIASLFLQFSACYQQKKNMKQPTNAKHAPEEAKNLTAPRYEIECVDIREKRRTARTSGKNHLKKNSKAENQKLALWCALQCCDGSLFHNNKNWIEALLLCCPITPFRMRCVCMCGCDGVRFRLTLSLQLIG